MEKVTPKVLILGATGMLGHVLYHTLKTTTTYEVVDLVFRNKLHDNSIICDVTDKDKLAEVIRSCNPDIIVNAIGVLIKGSAAHPANAIYINSYLPHYVSELAASVGAYLIHVSTDCVFSGEKGGYLESDFRDADDVYGRSKALGELNNTRDLTIRTSIIGPEIKPVGEGLLHWFLNQEGSINGFTKAYWGGVTTLELSKAIVAAISQDVKGLIHLTNGIAISKLDMLCLFKAVFKRDELQINAIAGKAVDKSLKTTREDFTYQVPSYAQMFTEMHENMLLNNSLYITNYTF